MRELQRVCRPDGVVLIVNHFAEPGGLRGLVERKLARLSNKLGWRPDFPLEAFLRHGSLQIVRRYRAAPLGLFTILHCINRKTARVTSSSAA
jgi:phosphatidylethanolamine/phosphatidyl-N-methylethanolamine N-methyltransferase